MRNTNNKKEYSNNQESSSVIDAASAVVASMNQKLQNTMKELAEVKKALENERKRQKN
jgi:ABC-type Fe3+-citrate transport system substrate-binding protein